MSKKQHKGTDHNDFILEPDLTITFKGKESLKRSEETGIPLEDEAVIAIMEGDSFAEAVNDELAILYAGTRLQPDRNIAFPSPLMLKKRPAILPVYARYAAAAVISLLFAIGAWYLLGTGTTVENKRYELAEIQMIELQLTANRTIQMDLSSREVGQIQVSTSVRDSYELKSMASLSYTLIDPVFTTNSTDLDFQYRQSNPQPSTSNIAYANAETKKKGLLGRIFSGFFNRVAAPFEGSETDSEKSSGDGFLWNVAQLGVKSVNVLGDHDYTLVRDYNEKGNVKGVIVLDE